MHLNDGHDFPRRTAAATALLLTILLASGGCAPARPSAEQESSVEALFLVGTPRPTVEAKYGQSKFIWVGDNVPDDEFAAATMREMISLGKPRPRAYQVFFTRRLDLPTAYYRDYVFYNDANRILYVARRKD